MREQTLEYPVSLLFPVCNEADVIAEVIEEWIEDVFSYLPEGSEMIFDDASSDGTEDILQEFAHKYDFIKVYHQDQKDGFFKSAFRLYQVAKCPLIFFTDSDGQYIPSEFWKLVPFINNYDIVHGAKFKRKDAFHRLLASSCFNQIAKLLFRHSYPDINSAYRLIHRQIIDKLLLKVRYMPTLLNAELLLRSHLEGYQIKSVYVAHRHRKSGVSRGLPLKTFLLESYQAYQGLLKLRGEYSKGIKDFLDRFK